MSGVLALVGCSKPAPAPAPESAAAPSTSAAPAQSPAPSTPPAPSPPITTRGADDTPIIIGDGSLWIGLNPLNGHGGTGKQITFDNFDMQPGASGEVRSLTLLRLFDGTTLNWDGIDINGTPPQACQDAGQDCSIQLRYEGPGMDVEVAWKQMDPSRPGRSLVLRFPGRPVGDWINWVRGSRIIMHPVDWDHSARKRIDQLYVNGVLQTLDPNATRITIHLKPAART